MKRTRPRAGFVLSGVGERSGAVVRFAVFVVVRELALIR